MELEQYLGAVAHKAAKVVLVKQGWADHPMVGGVGEYCKSSGCILFSSNHHADMVEWKALPADRKQYFIAVGKAGFEAGIRLVGDI